MASGDPKHPTWADDSPFATFADEEPPTREAAPASTPAPAPGSGPVPGDVVEKYEVVGPLGAGGMARVFKVRHTALGSLHALKVLEHSAPLLRERLAREGRIQARLRHPNLVPVTDVVEVDGRPGLVMDLVDGPDLKQWLAAGHVATVAEVRHMTIALLQGLGAAHALGVVHRDLKPDNVLLESRDGAVHPRIADFGIARAAEETGVTRAGTTMGTPAYMSPEQVEDSSQVDQRADLWSLGCILYEVLAGAPPFRGQTLAALFSRILVGRRVPLPDHVDPALRSLVDACLQVDRNARPDSCAAALALLGPQAPAPPAPRPRGPLTNLRPEANGFFGRGQEQAELAAALRAEDGRLWTLVGPGGTGKTRLSREVGLAVVPDFEGGAWFCELFDARDDTAVCAAVAEVLDVPLTAADPVQVLGDALRARGRVLLILDNAEQAVATIAGVVARWREAAPDTRFLLSSQEPVGLRGEQRYAVEGLPLPAPGDPDLADNPAVALFVARAQAVKRRYASGKRTLEIIAEIVRALDGLPLAIELAAARASMLSPQKLLQRLSRRFELLRSRRRDTSARHATLESTIDWSWNLLEPAEQLTLAQCAVFVGGFTLEAAEEVLDLSGYDQAPWPMDVVQALCDKSLVRSQELPDGEQRLALYQSIRDYAWRRLTREDPALGTGATLAHAVGERHGAWYARLGDRDGLEDLASDEAGEVLAERRAELQNLRAVVERGTDADHAAKAALAAAAVLKLTGPISEGAALLARSRRLAALDATTAAVLQAEEAGLRKVGGARTGVWETMSEASAVLEAIGTDAERAGVLLLLGQASRDLGETARSREELDLAESLARGAGDPGLLGLVLGAQGSLALQQGDLEAAGPPFEQALTSLRRCGHRRAEARVLTSLAVIQAFRGRLDGAARRFEQSLILHRRLGNRRSSALTAGNLGYLLFEQGQLAPASELLESALAEHRAIGNRRLQAMTLANLGRVRRHQGDRVEARVFADAALGLGEDVGSPRAQAWALALGAQLDAEEGAEERSLAHLERALALAERSRDRGIRGVLLGLAGELGAARDPTAALERFAAGEALLRGGGQQVQLVLLLCRHARVLRDVGGPGQAAEVLGQAQAVARTLTLAPTSQAARWLDELEATLADSEP